MLKNIPFRSSFKSPERGTCLGLQTSDSYELLLLEVACRGRKVFESSWNQKATIDEQVMFLEILEEIQLWEKAGCNNLLVERARKLVVRMKDHGSFHQRALVVYRDILCLGHSRTNTNFSFQKREDWVTGTSDFLLPFRNTDSSSSQTLTLDEVMSLEFPESDDDESSISIEFCSRTTEGQPTRISYELTDKFDEVSGESLTIFKKPTVTDEVFITPFDFTPDNSPEIDSNPENFDEEDSALTPENRCIRCIQLCSGDEPPQQSVLKKTIEHEDSKEFSDRDGADENIDLVDEQVSQQLGSFPGRDFKFLTWWRVDGVTYRTKSISDLRRKHNVLIEGEFRKRCRSRKWQTYYGFMLDTGIMLYFREGVFKKVADFRNCNHVLKAEQCRLHIKDLHLASRVTNWILKFASKRVCQTWYEIIVKISRYGKTEVYGLHDSLLASEYC